ncbi:MAG: hypothetical protein QOD07_2030 [Frankiaceae bacterium]|jgi:hypothetical protein|nr:hypothetical protein [Frankiaceae bacterium]
MTSSSWVGRAKKLGSVGVGLLASAIVVAVAIIGAVTSTAGRPKVDVSTSLAQPGVQLVADFGLSRQSITRTVQVDLCASSTKDYPECKTSSASDQVTSRPQVLSALVTSDLQTPGVKGQFPANQLSVTASNTGREGLLVTLQADPTKPYAVVAGTYVGDIRIERASGPPVNVHLIAELDSRSGKPTELAVLSLVAGALAGGITKWANDSLAPMGSLRSRYRLVRARLAPVTDELPLDVVSALQAARDSINSGAKDDATKSLDEVTNATSDLLPFGRTLAGITQEIRVQESEMARPNEDDFPYWPAAHAAELQSVGDLRAVSWPWRDAEDGRAQSRMAEANVRRVTEAMRTYLAVPNETNRRALYNVLAYVANNGSAALRQQHIPDDPPDVTAVAAVRPVGDVAPREAPLVIGMTTSNDVRPDSRRSLRERLLDWSPSITAVLTGAIVVFAGYYTQFVEQDDFAGGATAYLGLVIWTFTLQVTGITVVQAAGKFSNAGPGGQ